MKQEVKAKARKLVASILVAAMAVAIVPKIAGNSTVYAAGKKDGDNTCLGTSKMASPAAPTASSEWSGSKVYFGTYVDEPILFRVLAPNTTAYGGSTLFLDSEYTLFSDYFDNTSPYSHSWADSDIRATLNGSFLNGFTDLEKAAIATSSGNGGLTYDSFLTHCYGAPVSVSDKVFLLDASEVMNPAYGYSSDCGWVDDDNDGDWDTGSWTYHEVANREKGGSSASWWLRSATRDHSSCAGRVDIVGALYGDYVDFYDGVAPALNINQSSIIFSSLISGDFNTVGAVYKLTIKDPDLDIAVPSGQQVAVSGTTVTVPYEIGGTNAGTATRASILITDKAWDASGATIKLYDALGTNTDTSGTFTLPTGLDLSGWGTDYHVYILAEDINDGHGGKDTDYASAPVELASPIAATTYTIDVNVMTYDSDGVTLLTTTPDIGGTASVDKTTVANGDVVTVTATPNSGYTLKRIEWGDGAADGTDITSTKSFTVGDFKPVVDVYFQKDAPVTYTVTVTDDGNGTCTATPASGATGTEVALSATPSTGYQFKEWVITSAAGGTIVDPTSANTTYTIGSTDVTIQATFELVPVTTYTVTVNSGSADVTTVAQGATVTLTANAAPTGKEFDKWVVDSGTITLADATSVTTTFTMPAENVEVTATYKDIPATTFTVTFNTNGGSAVASQTVADGSKATKPADPTKDGYTFDGWYQDATFTVAFDFSSAITADITLYAKWTESVTPGTVYYTVVSGANGTWTEGDYVLTVKRSEADETCFSHFVGVKIDDAALVNGVDYTAASGSTVVTIKAATLAKLSKGGHTITVVFDDGQVITSITLKEAGAATPTPTPTSGSGAIPKTGEDTSMTFGLAVLCFVLSGAVFSVVLFERKKKNGVQ